MRSEDDGAGRSVGAVSLRARSGTRRGSVCRRHALGCVPRADDAYNAAVPPELTAARVYFAGRSMYDDMLADIEQARHDVALEIYIFDADEVGRRFADALTRQAAAGRRVRVVYDAWGCYSTPSTFFAALREHGIEVTAFNDLRPGRLARRWRSLDRRNHRKLLVVDERVAYLGGVNISARLADWEDAHVRVEGRIVRHARMSFERVWSGRHPRVALRRGRRHSLHKRRSILLDGFPAPNFSQIKRAYLHLFSRANRRIRIAHAYLIPDRKIVRALTAAVRRGVAVDVLVPHHSDVTFVDWALRHVLSRLLRSGVQVHMHEAPMLHSKFAVADERYAIVGSANLNRNSFFRNLEIAMWSRDRRIVAPLAERFDALWQHARPYTLAEQKRRPLWRRIISWAAYRTQFLLPVDQKW